MGRFIDLTGQRFGKLTVIERDTSRPKGSRVYWRCHCDCGNNVSVSALNLRNGTVKSCGCYRKEFPFKHGMTRTKIYRVWSSMKERCLNSNCSIYKHYGGRGIKVCDEWCGNFQTFYDYVSKLEHFGEDGYSLDRINNDGNYEPDNVRWATKVEQSSNLRTNHFIEIDGEQMTLSQATRLIGRARDTIIRRKSKGATAEQILSEDRMGTRYFEVNGEKLRIKDIVRITGLCYSTIYDRIRRGQTGADLLAPAKK